ncbi:MAG: T9SS type A sorting domain-containing protein, partial [Bacteroidia bacterium]|nr:T9SS type A sorting domain-containing protein [Bacteroidia bacterium]
TYRGGNNVSCNQSSDGAIYALVNDGAAPYTYQWSSGQTTANVSSISAGTYMLTVTDNNGCSATSSVTLKEPALLACSTDYLTNVGCNGNSDGEISISINGGIGPYVSMWNTTPVTFGTTLSNVPAGSYTLSVTDTNGCVDVQTYQVNEPQELSAWSQKVNVLCHGDASGAIDLKVSKGTAPYTYMWNDGATTQDRTGLNSGNYTVTVTDANGCIKIHDKRISQPRKFRHSSVVTDVSCFNGADGTIDLTITGAKAPYTYLWKDGTTTEDRINMSKGWHRVTVTDTRGCSTTRHIRVNHPKFLGITATVQDVSIPGGNDGSVSSSVSGGVGPYTYNWSNGATTNSISNIVSGNYRLTVTDANGCVRIRNVVVSEPAATAPLSCSPIGSNIPCGTSTGSVSVTATGGYPPYDYFWNTSPYQTTQTATGLAQGTYLVQVTDSRGASSAIFCFATVSCTNARTTTIVSEDESLLSVYPNPFSSELKINVLSAFEDETFELQIVDILGKTHHYSVLNTTKGINTHSLILDSLPDGVYFIRLKSNLSSFTEKLIKR